MRKCIKARTERFLRGDDKYPNPMNDSVLWSSPQWKIRSFNGPWRKC